MIGLDTSTIIDFFKNEQNLKELLEQVGEEQWAVTNLSYLELITGIDPQNINHNQEEDFYDTLFDNLFTFSLNKKSSKKARDFIWQLKKKGTTLHSLDAAIAAIFTTNEITKIITKNSKHFQGIQGLEVISY